jgi:NhaC family Na+:H+ antiporter
MKDPQEPGFLQSVICFGGVIVIVIAGLLWLEVSLHSLLLIAIVWVAVHSATLGFSFLAIKTAMISKVLAPSLSSF